jgi:uncharacterized protein YdhG (YjbR/CyaY superfamily)
MRKFKLKYFMNKLRFGVRLQNILDVIETRTKRIYLSHPFMWKLEGFYDNIAGIIRGRTAKEDYTNDPFVKSIRDFKEEMRIAKKYGFAKLTVHGYKMIRGFPTMGFPDSEFEERYAARKLNTARRISSWKKRGTYKN